MMKKIWMLILVTSACFSLSATNDGDILARIASANKQTTSVESTFKQTRTNAAKVKVSMSGKLYYKNTRQLSMLYSQPATDKFIISNGLMYVKTGAKSTQYTLSKSPVMNKLADYLLKAFAGQVNEIAKINNANCSVTDDGKNYVIKLTAKKTAAQGFSKITLKYRKSDCVLIYMENEEFNHLINTYELTGVKRNVTVSNSVFVK